jgi:peptidoglycan/xylan/chitin deacetylase (PgdA/CDA1 family)
MARLTVERAMALTVERGRVPAVLPRTLEEVRPPLALGEVPPGSGEPVTLFLTIDVEDSYFQRPILMTGDGIGREFGVFGILDQLDARCLKATFFVNVYEAGRQPRGVVEGVVREIAARGHEVGLHSHPSPGSELYRRPLFYLPREQQVEILNRGIDLIERWAGAPPLSFRAGGYACDDDTFAAIEEVGIAIDSSCFFPSLNNRQERFTVNAVVPGGRTVEVPVTTVLRLVGDTVEHRKLDVDWLSVEELMAALLAAGDHGAGFATFMMHSFSFIEKATRRVGEPSARDALFTSEDAFGFCVDVYGPKPSMHAAFSSFLERIVAEPRLRVRTLSEALPELRIARRQADVIPLVGEAAKASA